MRGWPYLNTMHTDRANLIIRYLSIRQFDLETRHTVVNVRILRSFLWYAMNKLMHVMQSWGILQSWYIVATVGILRSFSLIKSWVQNRVFASILVIFGDILVILGFEGILVIFWSSKVFCSLFGFWGILVIFGFLGYFGLFFF